jgi:hypothetical protein
MSFEYALQLAREIDAQFTEWETNGPGKAGPVQTLVLSLDQQLSQLAASDLPPAHRIDFDSIKIGIASIRHTKVISPPAMQKFKSTVRKLIPILEVTQPAATNPAKRPTGPPANDVMLVKHHDDGLFGEVWQAKQVSLSRVVAVKFLHPSMALATDLLEHARALARAGHHPHVVTVHLVTKIVHPKTNQEVDAVVMEWLDGDKLASRLKGPVFECDEAKRLCLQIVDGLAHIHAQGMTHGDLHSGNIILTGLGAKIIDIDYSSERSLSLITTMSREQRLLVDVQSATFIVRQILRQTSIDLTALVQGEEELQRASTLLQVRDIIQRLSSQVALFPGPAKTSGVWIEASEAIEFGRPNASLLTGKCVDTLIDELTQVAPSWPTEAGIRPDDVLLDALGRTTDHLRRFSTLAKTVAAVGATEAAGTLYGGFERIVNLHDPPLGTPGIIRDLPFDFYKFLGHELFVTFVESLISADRWELLDDLLERGWIVDTARYKTHANYPWIAERVTLLVDRARQMGRAGVSAHAELLKERRSSTGVKALNSFMAADFFLFVRDETWFPWSAPHLRQAPEFVIRATNRKYAARLAKACRVANIEELRSLLQERGERLSPMFDDAYWAKPFADHDLQRVGSK